MKMKMEKPEGYTNEVKNYLDRLRESNTTNMFGAGPYVKNRFLVSKNTAREFVLYWMETFENAND